MKLVNDINESDPKIAESIKNELKRLFDITEERGDLDDNEKTILGELSGARNVVLDLNEL